MTNDIPLARRDAITLRLAAGQAVNSSALATEYHVSEDAIRRDLRALAAAGLCRRVYGGALPLTPGLVPLTDRIGRHLDRKRALARAAVALIEPGSLIFLDNGSTNLVVAEELPLDADLTVATSSIAIAATLLARRDVQVLMIGGAVDRVIGGSIDGVALEGVARLNIDVCFLGACTLSLGGGVSAFDAADAAFKRALVAQCGRILLLVANEKLGEQAPHRILPVRTVDHVVIEYDASDEAARELRSVGTGVLRAEPPADPQA